MSTHGLAGIFFALAISFLAMAAVAGLLTLGPRGARWIFHYWRVRRLIARMRRADRYLSREEFEEHLANSAGTVLIEYSAAGWRALRVWWTSEDVLAQARAAGLPGTSLTTDDRTPGDIEAWCRDRYFDRQHGRALLVPIYAMGGATVALEGSLRDRSPALRVVNVRSAVLA